MVTMQEKNPPHETQEQEDQLCFEPQCFHAHSIRQERPFLHHVANTSSPQSSTTNIWVQNPKNLKTVPSYIKTFFFKGTALESKYFIYIVPNFNILTDQT